MSVIKDEFQEAIINLKVASFEAKEDLARKYPGYSHHLMKTLKFFLEAYRKEIDPATKNLLLKRLESEANKLYSPEHGHWQEHDPILKEVDRILEEKDTPAEEEKTLPSDTPFPGQLSGEDIIPRKEIKELYRGLEQEQQKTSPGKRRLELLEREKIKTSPGIKMPAAKISEYISNFIKAAQK